ncbi:MAG: Na+/H+ antiporter NhaA [Planctomycetota bacterium]
MSHPSEQPRSWWNRLTMESWSGLLLIAAAILAPVLDNSSLQGLYDQLLEVPFEIRLGTLSLAKPILLWINDGLMAIFFLLVGLEIKREIRGGRLSNPRQALLPAMAAIGGIVIPCMIFALLNSGAETMRGWAIPAATDIAFAVGILALLGARAPVALKVFLLAVAIIDDLCAVLIIAFFYTEDLSYVSVGLALVCSTLLFALNRAQVKSFVPYLLVGAFLWVCVLKSGVHATLAGVVLALSIPIAKSEAASPLHQMEHALKPWVLFLVMPLFALANAGVALGGMQWSDLLAPLPLGIALGLFIGKQIGVFTFTWVPVQLGWAERPAGTNWRHVYGASLLAGIGFTMSLFIGSLAFSDPTRAAEIRIGVLSGSLASGLAGIAVLLSGKAPPAPTESTSARSRSEPALTA